MARSRKPKPVVISPLAKEDIEAILSYLSENWNQKIVDEFLQKLQAFYFIISNNPTLFGYYNKNKNIRKYAISKQTVIYYRNRKAAIEIITVFDSRQNPATLKRILK